jgi:hypothetical protein
LPTNKWPASLGLTWGRPQSIARAFESACDGLERHRDHLRTIADADVRRAKQSAEQLTARVTTCELYPQRSIPIRGLPWLIFFKKCTIVGENAGSASSEARTWLHKLVYDVGRSHELAQQSFTATCNGVEAVTAEILEDVSRISVETLDQTELMPVLAVSTFFACPAFRFTTDRRTEHRHICRP